MWCAWLATDFHSILILVHTCIGLDNMWGREEHCPGQSHIQNETFAAFSMKQSCPRTFNSENFSDGSRISEPYIRYGINKLNRLKHQHMQLNTKLYWRLNATLHSVFNLYLPAISSLSLHFSWSFIYITLQTLSGIWQNYWGVCSFDGRWF